MTGGTGGRIKSRSKEKRYRVWRRKEIAGQRKEVREWKGKRMKRREWGGR